MGRASRQEPAAGRFIQPDTIVPDPANPQALNRYSYGLNNPLKYTDPTGHTVCLGQNADDGPKCFGATSEARLQQFNIAASTLNPLEQAKVASAAIDVGVALARTSGGSAADNVRPMDLTFVKSSEECADCWGARDSETGNIVIYSNPNAPEGLSEHTRFIVHEIGHVFDHYVGPGRGSDQLTAATFYFDDGTYASGRQPDTRVWVRTNAGYTCDTYPCQMRPVNREGGQSPGEDFADMFLNYVHNSFNYISDDPLGRGAGQQRYDWMANHMPEWLTVNHNTP